MAEEVGADRGAGTLSSSMRTLCEVLQRECTKLEEHEECLREELFVMREESELYRDARSSVCVPFDDLLPLLRCRVIRVWPRRSLCHRTCGGVCS